MTSGETTTVIRASAAIVHNGYGHRLLRDGVVVVKGDRIAHIGKRWDGDADQTIEAAGKIVIPGFISSHAHIGGYEGPRLLIDRGLPKFVRSGFLHFMPARRSTGRSFYSPADLVPALEQGFASLLRHGITTVCDYFEPEDEKQAEIMAGLAGKYGIRLYWSPAISGGRYSLEEDGRVTMEIDDRRGFDKLEKAAAFLDRFDGAHDGRLKGMIIVDEFYVSSPSLRQAAKALSRERGLVFTMHFLEQHREFFEEIRRSGKTPVQMIEAEGLLDDRTLLVHCVYVDTHSLVHYPVAEDIAIMGSHGVSVSHSPSGFARRGVVLESFDRYRAAGINVTLGTDMWPLEMFTEMRMASIGNKFADRNYLGAPSENVFDAATTAGARLLGRDDIGRLSVGAKADIVVVDTDNLQLGHNPDPLRALVHFATANMVDTVMVDGRILVKGGQLLVCDEGEINQMVASSSERTWAEYSNYHPDGVPITDHFPPSLAEWVEP